MLISSTSGEQLSAGILLEKNGERRLTTAIHCWDQEFDANPGRLGQGDDFTLTQGKTSIPRPKTS